MSTQIGWDDTDTDDVRYLSRPRYVAWWTWQHFVLPTAGWSWRATRFAVGDPAAGVAESWEHGLYHHGFLVTAFWGLAAVTGIPLGLWLLYLIAPPVVVAVVLVLWLLLTLFGRTQPIADPKQQLAEARTAEVEARRRLAEARAIALLDRPRTAIEPAETAALPPLPTTPWPLAAGGGTRGQLPIGVDIDSGDIITLPTDRHSLCAGMTGSGKSTTLVAVAAAALLDVDGGEVHLWSAKSDRDFRGLAAACTTFGGGPAALGQLATVLERIVGQLQDREAAGAPRCTVIIDEIHHALGHDVYGKRITNAVTSLAELGRSAGVGLILAVQRPTTNSIPLRIAEQCEVRVGLRVRTAGESRVLFGEDAADRGLAPHLFPADVRGLAWIDGVGAEPCRVRGWALDDATVAAVVTRVTRAYGSPRPFADDDVWDDEPARYDGDYVDGEVVEPSWYRSESAARAAGRRHPRCGDRVRAPGVHQPDHGPPDLLLRGL